MTNSDTGRVSLADCVNAASDVLRDVENGVLRPEEVERRVVAEMRRQFGQVNRGDMCWELQCDVARAVLEAAAYPAFSMVTGVCSQPRDHLTLYPLAPGLGVCWMCGLTGSVTLCRFASRCLGFMSRRKVDHPCER